MLLLRYLSDKLRLLNKVNPSNRFSILQNINRDNFSILHNRVTLNLIPVDTKAAYQSPNHRYRHHSDNRGPSALLRSCSFIYRRLLFYYFPGKQVPRNQRNGR